MRIFVYCFLLSAAFAFHSPSSASSSSPAALATEGAPMDFRHIIRHAKEQVFPAVIYVKCVRETMEGGRRQTIEVGGSGVITNGDGLALTNWHVVENALEVRCLLSDGRAMNATVLGKDRLTDLAVLQLHPSEEDLPLPYATLGDSSVLTEGDFVMAMGAPWGLNRSVSLGIIASTDRYLPGNSEYGLWLQTDASISPGNSGGPLVSTEGEIIGINTLGIMWGGTIGFSIPSNTIRVLLPHLVEHGSVNWAWTGLQLQPLRDFERNMYFDADTGVMVAETTPESPARAAGVRGGDRIVGINGARHTALTYEDLPAIRREIGLLPPGQPIEIDVVRNGEPMSLTIHPQEKGRLEGDQLALPRWDITVKAINRFDTSDLHFYHPNGVFIYGIRRPGNAQRAGFATRDIIIEVDARPIETLEDLQLAHAQAMERIESRSRIPFLIMRQGRTRHLVLDFARDFER